MKHRVTLATVDKLQSAVDAAARLHRLGLALTIAAILCVAMTWGDAPAWARHAGLAATALGFVIKVAGTLREVRLARLLGRIMDLPYRRRPAAQGSDTGAWAAVRSYVIVSAALTLAAALTPSMLASLGETTYTQLVVTLTAAALFIQSFDNPRRLRGSIMQICFGRMELHASDDGRMVA